MPEKVMNHFVTVEGIPVTQGSMQGFCINGHVNMVHQNEKELTRWRKHIADEYRKQSGLFFDKHQAVQIEARFYLPRPKSVKISKRPLPSVKPDADKMLRGLFDALTGVAYVDDAQVCKASVEKRYADDEGHPCGVEFWIHEAAYGKSDITGKNEIMTEVDNEEW